MNSIIQDEIIYLQDLIDSVPFNSNSTSHFLKVYKLNHSQLIKLNDYTSKFPIDSDKLLKLGISLGNLIKTMNNESEQHKLQNQQQKQFLKNNNKIVDLPILQTYQIRFVKNLFQILKNFDIGSEITENNRDSVVSGGTPHRIISNNSNVSPIKLNSKQLLIEKLEININLDNLFIYKIIFKLFIEIYKILQCNLINDDYLSNKDIDESSSIFSSNSLNSGNSSLTNDEYLKIINRILDRLSIGIIQPFIILIYKELVEGEISNEFNKLINNLQ
ncbi:unnamed protein product [Candida verbasci]|uniref:Uncharacterized protein n=1 Tax=Candida verbasci TaxID=1227364 RepID=A0A9W4XB55_9ASCO|nr:unnamed protein product [Candida verbasci]